MADRFTEIEAAEIMATFERFVDLRRESPEITPLAALISLNVGLESRGFVVAHTSAPLAPGAVSILQKLKASGAVEEYDTNQLWGRGADDNVVDLTPDEAAVFAAIPTEGTP